MSAYRNTFTRFNPPPPTHSHTYKATKQSKFTWIPHERPQG